MYPQADQVVALSQGVADELRTMLHKAPRNGVKVIHNAGIDAQALKKVKKERENTLSSRRQHLGDAPLIVACGRLTKQKGFPYLIEAMSQVRKHCRAHLWILGEGEQRSLLENKVEQNGLSSCVELLGFRDDPLQYMAAGDLFVLSSLWEGFGNVIVEAMACGTATVATACPHGPDEIIRDGESGLLVPPGDADALAKAILRVLEQPQLRRQLQEGGQARAQDFEPRIIASKYGDLFTHITSR
jgi:glycosyltransferase involved in cell wall biosynthesis